MKEIIAELRPEQIANLIGALAAHLGAHYEFVRLD